MDRGKKSLKVMRQAADNVINGKIKLCRVSRNIQEICKNFLKRFIARYKEYPDEISFGYASSRQIFSLNRKTF